jgi:hypothetical protein
LSFAFCILHLKSEEDMRQYQHNVNSTLFNPPTETLMCNTSNMQYAWHLMGLPTKAFKHSHTRIQFKIKLNTDWEDY